MQSQSHEVTELLERVRRGDKDAENRLYEIVMPHLRKLAQHLLGGERPGHLLQGTELVNRMYVRLAGSELSLRDRAHFFAIAARAMRRELIDDVRRRPKAAFLPIEGLPEKVLARCDRVEVALTVDELLEQMKDDLPPECCPIVELKFFFAMTDEETAEALNLPLRTMQLRWQDARIWLFERAEAQQWRPTKRATRAATS